MIVTEDLKNILFLLNKKQKLQLFVVFLIFLLNIFFDLLGIGMIIPIINIIIGNEIQILNELTIFKSFIDKIPKEDLLFYSISFFLIFYLIKTFYSTFAIWYQKRFIYKTSKDFSEKLLKKYLSIKYLDFLNKNQSDLVRNIVFESAIFITSIVHSMIDLTIEILLLIGIGILLISYDPISATILILIVTFLGFSYIVFFRKKLKKLGQKRQDLTSKILKVLTEGFILQKEVRVLQKENFILRTFSDDANEIANISIFEQIISSVPKIWFELIAVIGLSSIVFYFLLFKIEIELLVPLLGLYAAAIFRLLPCANRIIGASNNIAHNLPSFNVIFNELINSKNFNENSKNENEKNNKFKNYIFQKFDPKILCLKNLSFAYDKNNNNKKVLNNINLIFKQGEITGIVGKSGSGKSTIANIISGLIEEYDGLIEINNNANFNLNILRRSVGYVPQITNLLDDTIKNNICFGMINEKIDNNKLDKIISEVELKDLIINLKDGINTVIGDQGLTLSGGQRQKIALARTLYLDPKIIIFDESTNSLDKFTEDLFFKNIVSLKKNKIIICITHDLVLSKHFDKIYNLSDINSKNRNAV